MTDAQLVQSARASDADAWRTLYERYLPLVWRRAYALVGDVHAAEDVTSETMLALVRNLDRLEGDAPCVAGWLASVVSRQAAEHHRQVYRARDKLAAAAIVPSAAAGDVPSAPLEREETRARCYERSMNCPSGNDWHWSGNISRAAACARSPGGSGRASEPSRRCSIEPAAVSGNCSTGYERQSKHRHSSERRSDEQRFRTI